MNEDAQNEGGRSERAAHDADAKRARSPDDRSLASRAPFRASGLATLLVLVVLGVGVTAGYMQWKAPEVHAIVESRKKEVAAAPSTVEGRLVYWLKYADALIHNRLQEMRFSAEKPWLVAFARSIEGAREVEFYGIDLAELPRNLGRIEATSVYVRLPRAQDLGRGELTGDKAAFIPLVAAERDPPDANERARALAEWALEPLARNLERDIPGAHLLVAIGPETSWREIAESRAREKSRSMQPASAEEGPSTRED
jgi:hypothetical protein